MDFDTHADDFETFELDQLAQDDESDDAAEETAECRCHAVVPVSTMRRHDAHKHGSHRLLCEACYAAVERATADYFRTYEVSR